MGGVYADSTPMTMPSIPNVLNRFSRWPAFSSLHHSKICLMQHCTKCMLFVHGSATMNQLYHPARTAAFFQFLGENSKIPVFAVTNNVVQDLMTFANAEKKQKTLDGVTNFLKSNGSVSIAWAYHCFHFACSNFMLWSALSCIHFQY